MLRLIKLIYLGIDSLCIINRNLTQWSLNEIFSFAVLLPSLGTERMELYGNYFCLTRCFTFVDTPTKNNSPKGGQLITDLHDLTPPWVALKVAGVLNHISPRQLPFFSTYEIDGEKRSQNRRLLFCWEVARRCLIKMHHLLTPSSFNLPF